MIGGHLERIFVASVWLEVTGQPAFNHWRWLCLQLWDTEMFSLSKNPEALSLEGPMSREQVWVGQATLGARELVVGIRPRIPRSYPGPSPLPHAFSHRHLAGREGARVSDQWPDVDGHVPMFCSH